MGKEKKKISDLAKKELGGFKEFISKGNVIDLAVGVIIGGAFGKIVSSIVNDILMPLIGIVLGGVDFTSLNFKVKSATINYGQFLQNVVDFLIIAVCVYVFVSVINKILKKEKKKEEAPKKSDEVILLEEIRDLLKNKNK
ncbi:MAG: large-conductance mechanosensitive channel protein MscL [Bacilli bacterium]|nr:large-conductance mechanosensitive channel protein MscL [Bacilli bacterium]